MLFRLKLWPINFSIHQWILPTTITVVVFVWWCLFILISCTLLVGIIMLGRVVLFSMDSWKFIFFCGIKSNVIIFFCCSNCFGFFGYWKLYQMDSRGFLTSPSPVFLRTSFLFSRTTRYFRIILYFLCLSIPMDKDQLIFKEGSQVKLIS